MFKAPRWMRLASVLTALMVLPASADEVTVFAAASLKNALDTVAADFSAQSGHSVSVSYAGSGQLANQIIAGAPADIFLSAAPDWMDQVEAARLLAEGSRVDLLGNSLVLIGHDLAAPEVTISDKTDFLGLLGGEKLAMALVDAVPAGQYGKAALTSLGLWEGLRDHVAQSDNVRATLTLVARGEAPYGIVYSTDAAASDQVKIMGAFPPASYPPIIYPMARLASAEDQASLAFYHWLISDSAAQAFRANGFVVLDRGQ